MKSDPNLLAGTARAGDCEAQVDLGGRLLTGRGVALNPQEGVALLERAAASGHGQALSLLSVAAARGVGRAQNWDDAFAFVKRAGDAGDAQAQRLNALLGGEIGAWLDAPAPTPVFESPQISVFQDFLPREACAWIVERARPRLERARIHDPRDGDSRADEERTNSNAAFLFAESDLLLQIVDARMAAAFGMPLANQEIANILHYEPGEQFRPHVDFINPDVPEFREHIARNGQRVATALIYLNDDYEGGETDFLTLGWRFKGKAGDALFFMNVTPDGAPDRRTPHAGLAPTSGEKWVLSKWIRDRPMPLA